MLYDMPIGNIKLSTDDNLDNYFGFCYVSINVSDNIYNPILPFRDSVGNIYYLTGNWCGWYSSEILKFARDVLNIDIKVHYGYKYQRGKNLFYNYIMKYFNIKKILLMMV